MNAVVDNMEIRLRKSNYENEQFKSDLDIDKNLTYIRKDAHIKEEPRSSCLHKKCTACRTMLKSMKLVCPPSLRGYSLNNDISRYTEKRRKVYAFLRIPIELEKFLFYGFLQCVDAFCYLSTFLPIRLFMSIFGWLMCLRKWTSANTCDLLKALIIIITSFLMQIVRGQGVIKLYIFYNMLEVADKLFSSFGQKSALLGTTKVLRRPSFFQASGRVPEVKDDHDHPKGLRDILDALFWTATEKSSNILRTLAHLLAAVVYAVIHTILVLLQATTLNVAFNSHNQALLTIMMSNNFVELKGSVFKKFAKANLFQMSCSDVRERFHILMLLSVVVIRNMMAVNWKTDHLIEMLPDLAMVIVGELMVDWLKHAFITKFNEIPAEVYQDFTITIAYDVVKSRDEDAFSDYSDQVSRRMGFIPIPLTIMFVRVLTQSFSFNTMPAIFLFGLAWILLFIIKVFNGIVLLGKACEHVNEYRDIQAKVEFELYRKRVLMMKSKSAPSSPRISLVDFSDVLHQTSTVKGFTVSDLMAHWDELRSAAESKIPILETSTPRRTQSLAIFRPRRDKSLPPSAAILEVDEKEDNLESGDTSKATPRRRTRTTECESLTDVQAYTLLNFATENSGEIHSNY
ncbi:unnamed protein product [Dracunculus medinensis]|uniref:Protein TAPT1 homolog n=1 Tax=Dracunculus medinensis TaxID=318479 RepID=A0A0N4U4H4_DRAME|nr:unnamed protein product [Dracunculus medinensis]